MAYFCQSEEPDKVSPVQVAGSFPLWADLVPCHGEKGSERWPMKLSPEFGMKHENLKIESAFPFHPFTILSLSLEEYAKISSQKTSLIEQNDITWLIFVNRRNQTRCLQCKLPCNYLMSPCLLPLKAVVNWLP